MADKETGEHVVGGKCGQAPWFASPYQSCAAVPPHLAFAKTFLAMEAKLKDDEVQALKAVLGRIVIRSRTGEVGIMHGMERFVSTQLCMKKQQLDALDSAAKTLGLSIPTTDK